MPLTSIMKTTMKTTMAMTTATAVTAAATTTTTVAATTLLFSHFNLLMVKQGPRFFLSIENSGKKVNLDQVEFTEQEYCDKKGRFNTVFGFVNFV